LRWGVAAEIGDGQARKLRPAQDIDLHIGMLLARQRGGHGAEQDYEANHREHP